jgi:hypothetical protein
MSKSSTLHKINDLESKVKLLSARLDYTYKTLAEFIEFSNGYCNELARSFFAMDLTEQAVIKHFDIGDQVVALIAARKAEMEAEQKAKEEASAKAKEEALATKAALLEASHDDTMKSETAEGNA